MQYTDVEKDSFSSGVVTDADTYNAALLDKIETLIQVGACYVNNTQRVLGPQTTGQFCDQTVLEKNSAPLATVYVPVNIPAVGLGGVFDRVLPKGCGTSQYWISLSVQSLVNPESVDLLVEIEDSQLEFENNNIRAEAVGDTSRVLPYISSVNYPNNIYSSMMDYYSFITIWDIERESDAAIGVSPLVGYYFHAQMDSWITPNRWGEALIQNSTYHPLDSTDLTGFLFTGCDSGAIPYFALTYYIKSVGGGIQYSRFNRDSLNDTDVLSYGDRFATLRFEKNRTGYITLDFSLYRTNQGII